MQWVSTERVLADGDVSAVEGHITWAPAKSLWLTFHAGFGAAGLIAFPEWDAFAVFLALSAATLCAGHSVGMHRLLIHRSFETPLAVERLLVWFGTLVGMAGPFGMIRAHDMRDWHQRQVACPPHPSHGAGFWRDAWWQLHCEFRLARPPRFEIEAQVAADPFYRLLEATWMLQQVPLAVVLWVAGGWSFVLWGVSLRIAVSLLGHWAVGHYAHRSGHQGWRVAGLPVQGYNRPGLGILTFGENWHGNHHAFPHSARLGIERGQRDPGYVLIRVLAAVGAARGITGPDSLPEREGLERVSDLT